MRILYYYSCVRAVHLTVTVTAVMLSHMLHLFAILVPVHVVLAVGHLVGGQVSLQYFVFDRSDHREIQ